MQIAEWKAESRWWVPRLLPLGLVFILHSALCIPHLAAHPVPRSEHDRNVTVTWRSDGVFVKYRLEIDEYTLLTTVARWLADQPGDTRKPIGRKEIADEFIKKMKPIIADKLIGWLDGKQIQFTCTDGKIAFLDSAQFEFRLKATVGLNPGKHTLEVEDSNFSAEKGRLAMKFEAEPPLAVQRVSEPPESRIADTTEADRRTVSATVLLPGTLPPESQPTPPPPDVEPSPPAVPAPTGFWESLKSVQRSESLTVLLNSDLGLWLILLVAFVHGALHSLSPGHGKTMVAAYLVGEQGTPRHAVILGLIVTLSHTSAVFAVAILLRLLPERAGPTVVSVLGVGGGLLAAFIGLWLLVRRVGGDGGHGHSHSHAHGHGHSHSHGTDGGHGHSHGLTPDQFGRLGWMRLTLLGISGGAIPCVSAILWVVCCVAAGRFGMALWVVLAFSLGLALVLVLIGLSVVWGGRAGAGRFGNRKWFQRLSRWLPVAGAVTVIVVGLLLARASLPE